MLDCGPHTENQLLCHDCHFPVHLGSFKLHITGIIIVNVAPCKMHLPNKGCVIRDKTMRLKDEYGLITNGLFGLHPNMFLRQMVPKTCWFKLDRLDSGYKSIITPLSVL